MRADDRVELELDAELATPLPHAEELRHVLAGPAADRDVGPLVEAVAAHAQHVDPAPVRLHPPPGHLRAIGDDADALEPELLFAEATEHGQFRGIEKRLAPREVDLAHAGVPQEAETPLHLLFGCYVGCLLRVEAKAAFLIALPREVVIDGDWTDRFISTMTY